MNITSVITGGAPVANRIFAVMDVKEIRKRNLLHLLFIYKQEHGVNKRAFAEKCDTDPAVISQLISKSPKNPKSMGDVLARKIERQLALPYGWMDNPNWAQDDAMIELVSQLQDAINPQDIDALPVAPRTDKYRTVTMRGSSMESSNPKKSIPDGARLLICTDFDPEKINGLVVMVELEGMTEPTIKEIQLDGDNKYLIPWNDRFDTIRLTGNYRVIGYVRDVTITLSS